MESASAPENLELVDPIGGGAQPFASPAPGSGPPVRPSWSQDASRIAFYEAARGVVLKQVAGGAEQVLLPANAPEPTLSRSSDEIAYFQISTGADFNSYRTLKVTTLDGKSTRTLTQPILLSEFNFGGGVDLQPAWSPDGKWIAFHYHDTIVKVPSTGPPGPLTPIVPSVPGTDPFAPSFSPDGKRLAYVRFYDDQYGSRYREKLHVRTLDTGAETTLVDHPTDLYHIDRHGPQSWSPDGTQIAYGHVACTPGVTCDSTLNVVNADGSGDHELLHRFQLEEPAWSAGGGPVVTIQAPAPNARLTGREAVGAAEQKLTIHVESAKPLAGVCYAVQTDPTPVPDQAGCTNASGPAAAPFDFTTDLRPLIDNRTLKDGDNVIRVWAYDQDGARGGADVKIVLGLANYYVKHVEVAQALSPLFDALNAGSTPPPEAPYAVPWTLPSFAGFPIPLIGGRSTLMRIYVGDATLEPGKTDTVSIHFKVTAGAAVQEGDQEVVVTAGAVAPTQSDRAAAINVWLPGSSAPSPSTLSADVEVNAGEARPECKDCFPHGNKATVSGISFEQGGTVHARPVPILLRDAAGKIHTPSASYGQVWSAAEPYLPVADGGVAVATPAPPVIVTIVQLTVAQGMNPTDEFARCVFLLDVVGVARAMSAAPADERWVGTASPPDPLECNGIANMPGKTIVLTVPRAETFAHELGHSVGLDHTLSLAGEPDDAAPLPYVGIGAVGYEKVGGFTQIYNPLTTSDLMGYDANNRWTSPATWFRMHQGILGGVTASASARAAAATDTAATPATTAERRLVSGYISGNHGVIFSSLVAPASAPSSAGPVAGKLIALDARGHALASASVTGNPANHNGAGAVIPFVIALPSTARAASLALRAPNGKTLATLRRSRHAPRARFIRLPRRASSRKQLTVRWKATDADRDPLTVALLARRGKRWQTIALGPAAYAARVKPSALGRSGRLLLRLLVSDGFTTTSVDAKPVLVRR